MRERAATLLVKARPAPDPATTLAPVADASHPGLTGRDGSRGNFNYDGVADFELMNLVQHFGQSFIRIR